MPRENRARAVVVDTHLGGVERHEHRRPRALKARRWREQVTVLENIWCHLQLDAMFHNPTGALARLGKSNTRTREQFRPRAHQRVPGLEDFRAPRRPFGGSSHCPPVVEFQR